MIDYVDGYYIFGLMLISLDVKMMELKFEEQLKINFGVSDLDQA